MVTLHRRSLLVGPFISSLHHNETSDPYTKEMTSVANVIWVILLCGLAVGFGLYHVIRCALQRGSTSMEIAGAQRASTSLGKPAICQLSTLVLGSEVKISVSECTICLEEFADGQRVRVLPKCGHEFHAKCIDKWFVSHSSCPNCRSSLLECQATIVAPETANNHSEQGGLTSSVTIV